MPAGAKTGQEAGDWLARELLRSPPPQREIGLNSICQAWLGRSSCVWPLIILDDPFMFARSLTGHPEASELWKQLTSSVDASPSPSPTAFWPLCFWPLGSRSKEALYFSAAGFVSSIVCAFPIVYLTAFLTEVMVVWKLWYVGLQLSAYPSPPLSPFLLLCVFLLQESQDSEEELLFKVWPLWCTLWLVVDALVPKLVSKVFLPFTGMLYGTLRSLCLFSKTLVLLKVFQVQFSFASVSLTRWSSLSSPVSHPWSFRADSWEARRVVDQGSRHLVAKLCPETRWRTMMGMVSRRLRKWSSEEENSEEGTATSLSICSQRWPVGECRIAQGWWMQRTRA